MEDRVEEEEKDHSAKKNTQGKCILESFEQDEKGP